MRVALATAPRLFPSADGNQCHVPGRQAPPSSGKLEKEGGEGGGGGGRRRTGRTKRNAEEQKSGFSSSLNLKSS